MRDLDLPAASGFLSDFWGMVKTGNGLSDIAAKHKGSPDWRMYHGILLAYRDYVRGDLDTEMDIFIDVWQFYARSRRNLDWNRVVAEADALHDKYRGNILARALLLAVVKGLEERAKK